MPVHNSKDSYHPTPENIDFSGPNSTPVCAAGRRPARRPDGRVFLCGLLP
jgi:hypothetical protein